MFFYIQEYLFNIAIATGVVAAVQLLRYARNRKLGNTKRIPYGWQLLFFVSLLGIFSVTLLPIGDFSDFERYTSVNLIPVWGTVRDYSTMMQYRDSASHIWGQFSRNILGNFILFIPFGMFLPLAFPRFSHFKHAVLIGMALSVGIEVMQFIGCQLQFMAIRVSDIDDVILNTLGSMAGWGITALFGKVRKRAVA